MLGVALAGIGTWWTWRALHDPRGYDFRLAYKGGQVAWATGHPEEQPTRTGTPLLAAVLALLSRLESLRVAGNVLAIVNAMLVVVAVVVWIAVAVLGVVAFNALRGSRDATSWELFAFACPLSAMLSPLAWSHYQILLVPLFVLLLVRSQPRGRAW